MLICGHHENIFRTENDATQVSAFSILTGYVFSLLFPLWASCCIIFFLFLSNEPVKSYETWDWCALVKRVIGFKGICDAHQADVLTVSTIIKLFSFPNCSIKWCQPYIQQGEHKADGNVLQSKAVFLHRKRTKNLLWFAVCIWVHIEFFCFSKVVQTLASTKPPWSLKNDSMFAMRQQKEHNWSSACSIPHSCTICNDVKRLRILLMNVQDSAAATRYSFVIRANQSIRWGQPTTTNSHSRRPAICLSWYWRQRHAGLTCKIFTAPRYAPRSSLSYLNATLSIVYWEAP